MTRSLVLRFAALPLSIFLVCCGGSSPPPDNPEPIPLDDPDTGNGDVVAPSSAKVKAGMDAIQAEDFSKAKQLLSEAAAADPKDPQAAFYLGVANEGLKDFDAAAESYKQALALDPKLVDASNNLSAILLEQQEDAKGALQVIDGALKHAPKHPGLLTNRALALEAVGDKPGALKAYGAAVEASPKSVELRYTYAELLGAAGEKDKALAQLKQVASEDAQIQQAIAQLYAKLGAFAECIAAFDKLVEKQATPDLLVRRGACRHGMKDDAGALKDYQEAIKLDENFAPGHYYLGQHYLATDKKKAKAEFTKAKALGGDTPVGKAAQKELEKLGVK